MGVGHEESQGQDADEADARQDAAQAERLLTCMYAKCNPHYAEMLDWLQDEQERRERERAESAATAEKRAEDQSGGASNPLRVQAGPVRESSRPPDRLSATDRGRIPDGRVGGLEREREGDIHGARKGKSSRVPAPDGRSGQTDEREE
jgi:hypothetical protein